MSAQIIDGRAIAAQLRQTIARRIAEFSRSTAVRPGLAVVLVGEDPASKIYVNTKTRMASEIGIQSFDHRLPQQTQTGELLSLITQLNARADVHGILVQLPLPVHIDTARVLAHIDVHKDVDGFTALNAGKLALGEPGFIPCTPLGCLLLLGSVRRNLSGARALVIGRSNIVGKPMAQLLLQEHCTVTIAHSRTRDLPDLCGSADIVVAAIGRPEAIRGEWLKKDSVVIDVGINRVTDAGGNTKLVGDVEFSAAHERAAAITPVPGGVGPMTIACLLLNTANAALRSEFGPQAEPIRYTHLP